jgi:hybrid cluster-associated redox disulfide protein
MTTMGFLIDDDMTMDEIMRRWPLTIRVVIRSGLLCVGCPIASFHTVADAAREHGLDEALLRSDLEAATSSGGLAAPMSSASDLRPA